nr:hypothetical protein [Tanacetum cinerariifolium]
MTGNKERLDDFQVIKGGKVTFGGREDTECLMLSKDFKLPDESMVVLKVFAPVPTGLVPTDRGYTPSVIFGWWKRIDGQLLLSPQQVVLGKHIEKENPFPDAEDEGVLIVVVLE